MAAAYKGPVSMGMVPVSVGLYKTIVHKEIHIKRLDKESKTRITYKR